MGVRSADKYTGWRNIQMESSKSCKALLLKVVKGEQENMNKISEQCCYYVDVMGWKTEIFE